MTYEIILKQKVKTDLFEAILWYDSQAEGLGARFKKLFYSILEIVAQNPRMRPNVYKEYHRVLMREFPFGIYYKIQDKNIYIFACMDLRRNPNHLLAELSENNHLP